MKACRAFFQWLVLVVICLAAGMKANAVGVWIPLNNTAPDLIDTMLLLPDGTVMGASGIGSPTGGTAWYKLTPDSKGSYVNGTWSILSSMHDSRLYYSSQVLRDGRVLVAGAEYGSGWDTSEIYDPLADVWTEIPVPAGLLFLDNQQNPFNQQNNAGFIDSGSVLLPNGNVLVAPVVPANLGTCLIFDVTLNSWLQGPAYVRGMNQDEASWVKLPDDSILTIDPFGTNSERYIPSLNQWVNDSVVPVAMYDVNGEMGAAFMLADGRAFYLGATGNTAFYTPTGNTNAGTWTAGPVIPNSVGTPDAPAAMMVNGKILLVAGQLGQLFNPPIEFFEYDPVTNGFAAVSPPTLIFPQNPTYINRMLDLPDGTVLLASSSQQLYVYQPDGSPLPTGRPTISSVTPNGDGTFHLVGTLLNGISQGASYGDDVQMDSNYPLVRLTDASGNVFYARTFNWSSTSIMTGNRLVSTEFALPQGLPPGTYSLVVSANGNASTPVTFNASSGPSLVVTTNFVIGGNGNGLFDNDECNSFDIVLANAGTAGATGVHARLFTGTPGVTIVQRTSSYADIPVGSSATNSAHFVVSTAPNFPVGTAIRFTLEVTCAQNSVSDSFSVATGNGLGAVNRFDNNAAISIPSGSLRGTNSVIVVSNVVPTLQAVSVAVNILHPNVGELALQLIGPDGTTVLLSGSGNLIGADFGTDCSDADRTVFSDAGFESIELGNAPFIGTFQPDQPLLAFVGKFGAAVNGAWKLQVIDRNTGNQGSLQCWSLNLTPTASLDGGGVCPGVDLSVTMSAFPSPALVGNALTYTIVVNNNGPGVAHNVSLTQTLPSNVTFVSASASQGSANSASGIVNGNLGTLDIGASASVTVTVIPTSAGTIFSTASVGSSETDIDTSNNSVTTSTVVNPPQADVSLGLAAAPSPVLVGGVLTYTISVTNNGPSTAANAVVTNILPASVGILATSSSQGSSVNNSSSVITSLGTMKKGDTATITISVFPTVVGSITDTATVSSATADPIIGNNSASVAVSVTPAADVSVNMVSVPTSAVVGSNVSYLILVSNHGPSPAANVVVSDLLPPGVTFVSATNSSGTSFPKVGQSVNFTVTNLAVNGSALFTLTVGTGPLTNQVPLFITNSASVSSAAADPNLANNSITASTRVDSARPTIIAAGARLSAESIQPTNGFIDPGETVTVLLNLQNIGNVSTTNLVATLQSGGGVNLTAGTQAQFYGALPVGSGPVSMPFTFTAATNVSTVTATLRLQDGAAGLGIVQFSFPYPTATNFANTVDIVIPDHGEATPYPSSILVSGVSGLIDKVTVSLTNFNHTYPDDVDVLLIGPAGQSTLLMSHCGQGGIATNVSLTFDDGAASGLTISGQLTSGSYKPTQNGSVSFPASNTPAAPYGAALTAFNGTNANGVWSLYVFDSSPGDQGIIVGGWNLGIIAGTPVNQVVDLSVSGSGSPNPVLAGNNLTYTFSLTNNGPNTANSVAFTNMLPAGVNLVSATSSQGTCAVDPNGAVYCLLTNLPVGVSVTVSIIGTPTIPGSITNVATITSVDTDLNQFNNSAAIVTAVTAPVADIGVTMTASPNPVAVGGNVNYTVAVTNSGPGTAINVSATVPLGSLSFVSGIGFSNVSGTAVCQVGSLAAGAGTVISFVASPTQNGIVSSTVTAVSLSTDPNSANNTSSVSVNVVPPSPNVQIVTAILVSESFAPPNGSIDPGETVSVNFHLANVGTADTTNLVVTLLGVNGITPLSGPITNGVLPHGGAQALDVFSFSVAATNTGSVTALLQLQDGSANLGTLGYTFTLPASNGFANTGVITIPDSGAATPYPSVININGLNGVVSKATVTLNNLNHAFPNDVEVLLVGPTGAKTVLMSGAGASYAIRNVTLTFDDSAEGSLPANSEIFSGTYKPTENSLIAPFPSPAPAGPYVASLGQFSGTSPNGTWALYVFDNSPGDSGGIPGGWNLNLTTISPVNGSADISVAVSAPSAPVPAGGYFVYNITVGNKGPDTATGVALYETLPAGWYVTGSVPPYRNIANGQLQYDLGQMTPGAVTNVSITFSAPTAGQFTNVATVQAVQFDANPADNSATAQTSVFTPVLLSGSGYGPGSVFNFTLTGVPNTSYVIYASPDLSTWTPVGTNVTSSGGTFQFQDPNAGSFPRRYYRAQAGP